MSKVDEILDDLSSPELKAYRDIDKAKSSFLQMIEGLKSIKPYLSGLGGDNEYIKKSDFLTLFK